MDRVDAIVVGAGVVGLAVARALARQGREVVVLETEGAIGEHTSSRNSEVIHAGIYYDAGSLKARLCVEGRKQLYAYCADHGVEARRLGKFIVASSEDQLPQLMKIKAHAEVNGVDDLEVWDADRFHEAEPDVTCVRALYSPSTGIVDSHAYMLALQGGLEERGGVVAFNSPLETAAVDGGGFVVETGGEAPMTLRCDTLVNSAGLFAPAVAGKIQGADAAAIPTAYYARGAYFSLSGQKSPFTHLVYPIPEPGGLGVHATIDLAGQVRFGPDVEWIDGVDYTLDPKRADKFYAAIRAYWPALKDGALTPAYTGVRPKISAPGAPAADFVIHGPAQSGAAGLVNLFGIESPGLTSSLAIADEVAALLAR
jgi:L-2-hydroxyglutarate oxidase LhgO